MISTLPLVLCLAISAQSSASPPPDSSSSLHRYLELDDIDRELQKLREQLSVRRAKLKRSSEMLQRGSISRADMQREVLSFRYQEAREAELVAFRDFRAYEKQLEGRKRNSKDDQTSTAMLLNLLKKQEALVKLELDYTSFAFRQAQVLEKAGGRSAEDYENARMDYELSQANLALSQTRTALTAKSFEEPPTSEAIGKLRIAEAEARVRFSEIQATAARQRLTRAELRGRRGMSPAYELDEYRKTLEAALKTLAQDRKTLEDIKANPTKPSSRSLQRST